MKEEPSWIPKEFLWMHVGMVGSNKPGEDGEASGGIMGMMGSVFDVVKQVANTSLINAEKHIM